MNDGDNREGGCGPRNSKEETVEDIITDIWRIYNRNAPYWRRLRAMGVLSTGPYPTSEEAGNDEMIPTEERDLRQPAPNNAQPQANNSATEGVGNELIPVEQKGSAQEAVGLQVENNVAQALTNYSEKGEQNNGAVNVATPSQSSLTKPLVREPFISLPRLTEAELSSAQKRNICVYCLKIFTGRSKLRRHLQMHTRERLKSKDKSMFTCPLCSRTVKRKGRARHMQIHLGNRPKPSPKDKGPFTCPVCSKTLNRSGKARHMQIHLENRPLFKCPHCPKVYHWNMSLKRHIITHKGSFKCPECPKIFPFRSYLTSHLRMHTGERPFHCPYCSYAATQKGALRIHVRRQHPEKQNIGENTERAFKCPRKRCLKTFQQESHLASHLHTHNAQGSFKCPQCGKMFGYERNLKAHLKVHTGKRSFPCPYCPYAAFANMNLKYHVAIKHPEKQKLAKEQLEKKDSGVNIERPYKCPRRRCFKTFKQESHLASHLHTHYPQGSFKCPQCGKMFGYKGNLNIHLRVHTGERPFPCPYCTYASAQLGGLKSHVATMHPEKSVVLRLEKNK